MALDHPEDSNAPKLILASGSPRRRELLQQIGVEFEVITADIDEARKLDEKASDYVRRLCEQKAKAVSATQDASSYCLGADTTVVHGTSVLEKPKNKNDFVAMMSLLSGSTHKVMTGVCLCNASSSKVLVVSTEVEFKAITEKEMLAYWQTGEPQDKAGGYGIQGFGAIFVKQLQGSYSNVVGLPLYETAELLRDAGVSVWRLELRKNT